ncbi:MAG: hypothetical protein J4G05_06190 [Chlorobi bacterium]|nr:hypothetical protein [Chlorobiota bacterium]
MLTMPGPASEHRRLRDLSDLRRTPSPELLCGAINGVSLRDSDTIFSATLWRSVGNPVRKQGGKD